MLEDNPPSDGVAQFAATLSAGSSLEVCRQGVLKLWSFVFCNLTFIASDVSLVLFYYWL